MSKDICWLYFGKDGVKYGKKERFYPVISDRNSANSFYLSILKATAEK
jgi:hypothetical protein